MQTNAQGHLDRLPERLFLSDSRSLDSGDLLGCLELNYDFSAWCVATHLAYLTETAGEIQRLYITHSEYLDNRKLYTYYKPIHIPPTKYDTNPET
jgi:hypothetical protein